MSNIGYSLRDVLVEGPSVKELKSMSTGGARFGVT